MENFNVEQLGYRKSEVNDFVDYVIKKLEQNIVVIKNQTDEIARLQNELLKYKNVENTFKEMIEIADKNSESIKEQANKEAESIIVKAENNANRIVNTALLKAERIELRKEMMEKNLANSKKRIKSTLLRELELIDDIEIL